MGFLSNATQSLTPAARLRRYVRYAVALCVPLGVSVVSSPVAAAETITRTYYETRGEQTFFVPSRTYTVHVTATGAPGAGNGSSPCERFGGGGARVSADLSVTPKSTLYVIVGGHGGNSFACYPYGSTGGFNGGAAGGSNRAGGGLSGSDLATDILQCWDH